ncbi:MAG: hypothetical protein HUU27_09550, partial [Phycisphaerae bacterium]|nr:hypothetical protein [Phycisphaerae bacterium]
MHASLISLLILLGPVPNQDPQPSPAQPPTQAASEPAVIRATGIGRPPQGKPAPQAKLMARRAAEVVALRNLAAQLEGQALSESNGRISARTETLIRGFRYLAPRDLDDGSVEITVELPLPTLMHNHTAVADQTVQLESRLQAAQAELEALKNDLATSRLEAERARARAAQLPAEEQDEGHVAQQVAARHHQQGEH